MSWSEEAEPATEKPGFAAAWEGYVLVGLAGFFGLAVLAWIYQGKHAGRPKTKSQ